MKNLNKAVANRWMPPSTIMVILFTLMAFRSEAQTYNLATGGTSLQINAGSSSPGLTDWMVGGVNELQQQCFYYSVGGGDVSSINNINAWSLLSQTAASLSGSYADSTLSVTTSYTLENVAQGSSWLAGLSTQIAIQNLSGITQAFNFYQYSDFTIGGASGGQDVYFPSSAFPYTVYQYNPNNAGVGYLEGSINVGLGTTVEEVAGTLGTNEFGLGNGYPSPTFTDNPLSAGPGSVNFAYEFTATLAPDASITISEIQTVPEPSSLAMILSGILGLAFAFFYKRGLDFSKVFKRST